MTKYRLRHKPTGYSPPEKYPSAILASVAIIETRVVPTDWEWYPVADFAAELFRMFANTHRP
jgi:hypothetical protein